MNEKENNNKNPEKFLVSTMCIPRMMPVRGKVYDPENREMKDLLQQFLMLRQDLLYQREKIEKASTSAINEDERNKFLSRIDNINQRLRYSIEEISELHASGVIESTLTLEIIKRRFEEFSNDVRNLETEIEAILSKAKEVSDAEENLKSRLLKKLRRKS